MTTRTQRKLRSENDLVTSTLHLTLTPKKLGLNGKNLLQRNRFHRLEEISKRGKNGSVFFVISQEGTKFAVKEQKIINPENPKEKTYTELIIMKELSLIPCNNFVKINDWWKTRNIEEDSQSMFYLMNVADKSLSSYKTMTLIKFKNFLFQVLFSLFIAKTQLGFQHNDLHSKNLVIKEEKEDAFLDHVYGEKLGVQKEILYL